MVGFPLDSEQRRQLRGCLRRASVILVVPFDDFIARIERSINHFLTTKPEGTAREAHDELREIWFLSHEDDPSPALLRARLKSLPPFALEFLARRARAVLPRLFPGLKFVGAAFEPPVSFVARLLDWAAQAKGPELVKALQVLSADGGELVTGRSRGGGKRSAPRFEPRVLGVVSGSPGSKAEGGRPSEDARQALVMHLALDWCQTTGQMPARGRSDQTGFGEIVHCMFQWLAISREPYEAATYALRRFWDEVDKGTKR
jgi:hypothetical protein